MRRVLGALAAVLGVAGLLAVANGPVADGAAVAIHRVDEGHFLAVPGQPLFFLALGTDGRPGLVGTRSDAIHVVGVNPAAGAGTILNIPRDTYIPIRGAGRDKVNAAYQLGGPKLMADTVQDLTGIPISFVISTDFEGLKAMTDDLGGLPVQVPFRMADRNSGAFFEPGPSQFGGAQVLAFARNRHIPGGDFRRTENQGLLVLSALAKLRAEDTSPSAVLRYMAVLGRHVSLHGVGWLDLYRLGRLGLSIDPARMRNVTLPGSTGSAGAASVVFAGPGAASLFADMADDAVLQSH